MKRSAVILAGGFSQRFGQNKGLIELSGKPLVLHVLDKALHIVDEVVVVVSSDAQRRAFSCALHDEVDVTVDKYEKQSPLVGALTGFERVRGKHSLLLPCDTPFISNRVLSLLLDLCINRNAAIPRWPNEYIEPFQAAYRTQSALRAAETALEEKKLDMQSMILHMTRVRYISTLVLRQMDPKLLTFFNINTPEDLKRAESILKRRNSHTL
ncbi:MAG: molybdenum cofactor guanylyltransferase [Candidatus Bathyarchaeota archaeon]|nr:molybdenum cofactor guanylyltransferase [Candidatus Bathyarchaeota archaeon]